ncbi:MAG: hypothetical protein ACK56I_14145, partial [bacterium]
LLGARGLGLRGLALGAAALDPLLADRGREEALLLDALDGLFARGGLDAALLSLARRVKRFVRERRHRS